MKGSSELLNIARIVLCCTGTVVKKRGHGRMKHIALRMLAPQEWCAHKRLRFAKIHTDENESDMLTKPMTRERMIKLATKVGLSGGRYPIHGDTRGA